MRISSVFAPTTGGSRASAYRIDHSVGFSSFTKSPCNCSLLSGYDHQCGDFLCPPGVAGSMEGKNCIIYRLDSSRIYIRGLTTYMVNAVCVMEQLAKQVLLTSRVSDLPRG